MKLQLTSGVLRGARAKAASKPILTILLSFLALASWVWLLSSTVWPAATEQPWKRTASWVASRLAVEGQINVIYGDRGNFAEESRRLGAIPDIFEANAPTTILAYLPLADIPVDSARTIWILSGLACLISAWAIVIEKTGFERHIALLLTALLPLYEPLRNNIVLGQTYAHALLAAVLGVTFIASKSQNYRISMLAGAAFAILCIIRQLYGGFLLIMLLARRHWTALASAVGVYSMAVAVTLVWLGTEVWLQSIAYSTGWRERPETAVTAYQSLNNFLNHLFRYDQQWNPEPLADLGAAVGIIWWVIAAGVVGLTFFAASRFDVTSSGPRRFLPYAVSISASLLLAPISEDYHYTLDLLPIWILAACLIGPDISWSAVGAMVRRLCLTFAFLLLAWSWRFYNVSGTGGWAALAFYPRLYGNMILWGLGLCLMQSFRRHPKQSLWAVNRVLVAN